VKGELKAMGGSRSDDFNSRLQNQAFNTLWLAHSDKDGHTKQFIATCMAMASIAPRDELEGMLAAQMVATHAAAMECYRRAMLKEQSFEGRQDNLRQARKLSRIYADLVWAANETSCRRPPT
jgi:hypothetical protein